MIDIKKTKCCALYPLHSDDETFKSEEFISLQKYEEFMDNYFNYDKENIIQMLFKNYTSQRANGFLVHEKDNNYITELCFKLVKYICVE